MWKIIAFCRWCQHLPLPELATEMKRTGIDGVDLPCRPGAPIGPANAAAKLPEAKRILEDHGLSLDRLVTGIEQADAETEGQLEAIRKVGVKKIRLGGYPVPVGANVAKLWDDFRRKLQGVEKLLEKHGIQAGIQNHSGRCLEVNVSSTLRLLEDCDPKWVGIQCDPGHLTISGEPFDIAFDLIGSRLHSVNFKSPRQEFHADPVAGRLRFTPIWVPLRDGMLDVSGVLKKLKAIGYRESISIHAEYRTHYFHLEPQTKAVSELFAADVAYVRQQMAELSERLS